MDRWGSVDGDHNANAIISDRRTAKRIASWVQAASSIAFVAVAIWYGTTGSHPALAWLIVLAVWVVNGTTGDEIYSTHTFVMIAERRVQLLEQQMAGLRQDVADLLPRRSYSGE